MHLRPRRSSGREPGLYPSRRAYLRELRRAVVLETFGRAFNFQSPWGGPRVSIPLLRAGGVRVAYSVLYSPFDEMDLIALLKGVPYGSAAGSTDYFPALLRQLERVEREVAEFANEAAIARNADEVDAALATDKVAVIHCVEGGFHLGTSPDEVDRAVATLAARGIAYITVAHLFWRSFATNTHAFTPIPPRLYDRIFPQPAVGLGELGEAVIRAAVRNGVWIDISHMSGRALADTFELLNDVDPGRTAPVLASHVAFRFGNQAYNLDEQTIARVADRGGVVGLIAAEHQAADGLRRRRTESFADTFDLLCRHVERIRAIMGSHEHTAIGSDLGGFIRPLAGLENCARLGSLRDALVARYGDEDGERIASDNVLKLLRSGWGSAPLVDGS